MSSDFVLVGCQYCGTEGRIYHSGYAICRETGNEIGGWSEPCPACDGTGAEFVEAELWFEADADTDEYWWYSVLEEAEER